MEFLFKFILRFIPRKYLQIVVRCGSFLIAPFFWGRKYEDPISGKKYRKLLPYGRLNARKNALAPDSLSLERHRLLWLFLKNRSTFFSKKLKVLHFAPALCFRKAFKKMENLEYYTADLNSSWADIKIDARAIPFPANDFDVLIANHVLEHIEEDLLAMQEFYRVIRPGGWGIFMVPIDQKLEATYEDFSITDPREREKHFGQSDHVRIYGLDFADRLAMAGFGVKCENYAESLSPELIDKYCLNKNDLIFICQKKSKITTSPQFSQNAFLPLDSERHPPIHRKQNFYQ